MTILATRISSPVGELLLGLYEGKLCALTFPNPRHPVLEPLQKRDRVEWVDADGADFAPFTKALRAYFKGAFDALQALPVAAFGTDFYQEVWRELRKISPGETISYSGLAERLGRPDAVRAVAQANARNPVSIVVPCHRVIAKSGKLQGFGGGLDTKQWLLTHEGARTQQSLQL